MSITRRLIELARVNLGALLDHEDARQQVLHKLADEELEEELRRRRELREGEARARAAGEREARAQAERARPAGERASGRGEPRRGRASGAGSSAGTGSRGSRDGAAGRTFSRREQVARYYAQLECPQGADFDTVKRQYRKLMRKYHPDVHSGDAAKEQIANQVAQALTQAYNELEIELRGGPNAGR